MSTQWNTKSLGQDNTGGSPTALDEEGVILMQGKNAFGDRIYAYVKLHLRDLIRMNAAARRGENVNPNEYGSIVAAGKGEPTNEVKAEMATLYKVLDTQEPRHITPLATNTPPKAWDEY